MVFGYNVTYSFPDFSLCPTSLPFPFPHVLLPCPRQLTFLLSPPSAPLLQPEVPGLTCWSNSEALPTIKLCLENNNFLQTKGGDGRDTQHRAICLCIHFIQQTLLDSLTYCRNYARTGCVRIKTPLVPKVLRDE